MYAPSPINPILNQEKSLPPQPSPDILMYPLRVESVLMPIRLIRIPQGDQGERYHVFCAVAHRVT